MWLQWPSLSLYLKLISETLENSAWAESLVISTTELVGKLRPGQMKPLAQGCGGHSSGRSGMGDYLVPTMELVGSPHLSSYFLYHRRTDWLPKV